MKIYTLSPVGYILARSPRSPNTEGQRIVNYLYRIHSASLEKITGELGVSPSELTRLTRTKPPILLVNTGASV